MNVQIFGKTKCFDSKSAERFFKERKINYQFINLLEKGISPRELDNVIASVGDIDLLFDVKSKSYSLHNVAYITRSIQDKKELILEYPELLKTPIVRECQSRQCTVGKQEKIWKMWK